MRSRIQNYSKAGRHDVTLHTKVGIRVALRCKLHLAINRLRIDFPTAGSTESTNTLTHDLITCENCPKAHPKTPPSNLLTQHFPHPSHLHHRLNILIRLVRKRQIRLNSHRIRNPRKDQRCRDQQRRRKQRPRRRKDVNKRHLERVDAIDDGRARRLDALVKPGVVGQLAAVVRHGAHEPVDAGLPCSWERRCKLVC